jgi:hypothetical protein
MKTKLSTLILKQIVEQKRIKSSLLKHITYKIKTAHAFDDEHSYDHIDDKQGLTESNLKAHVIKRIKS